MQGATLTKKLKIKTAVLVAIVLAGMVIMGVCISGMQTNLALESYNQEMTQEAEALPSLLDEASQETEQNIATYDALFQSKAQSIAFMANNNAGYEATHSKMLEYKDLLDVDNIMIVEANGRIIAQA